MSEGKTAIRIKVQSGPGRQGTPTSGNSKNFAWSDCSETDARKRLMIKEQALEIGLASCARLIESIESGFNNIAKHSKQSAELIWSSENRAEWITQCQEIMKAHADFRVLVGVAGATGSGKTSALNALLGFQEMLPTNNEEAATAVQCKVAFNHDTGPEYAFRCHVTFQSKKALETKLEQFFRDLKLRGDLEASHNGSSEDEEGLRELESMLRPTREMINIVFGLQDDQIEKLGLDGVLKSNPEALSLLGTVKKYNSGSADEISKAMKPYMDSTEASHSISGASFAAWPLIEQVELFVKSDILRNGVVLVDLPGLGDAVESRALVAERSFHQLTSTMIVTQAARAADNSTAVNLMSKHHEMAMMMDGKFQKETFCVCLSQIDQIDRRAALRKPDAKANTDLQNWLEEEEKQKLNLKAQLQEQNRAKKTMEKLRKAIRKQQRPSDKKGADPAKKTAAKAALHKLKREKRAQKLLITDVSQEISSCKRRIVELDGAIVFACIQARNRYLQERIGSDFRKRQARLVTMTPGLKGAYDSRVAVCPTSAHAFWKCNNDLERATGFPSAPYTGIPALTGWIRNSTIPKREAHVDGLLNRLQAQYNTLQLWSKDKCKLSNASITKESFENDVLADALKKMRESLAKYWPLLTAEVNKLNPLNDKQEAINQCPSLCAEAVRGWAYKKPDDKASNDKVHWTTYQASLSRSGGRFVSRPKSELYEYNWLEDISNIMFRTIVKDWNQFLNHDIPSLTDTAGPVIDRIWDEFNENLRTSVQLREPRLLPELESEKSSLDNLKVLTKDRISEALRQVSDHAAKSHPLVKDRVQSEWFKPFQEALEIKGVGSHTARQKLLLGFAADRSKKMFRTTYHDLDRKLREGFDRLPPELESVSKSATRELTRYISTLLDKLLEPKDLALKMEAVTEEKARIRQSVQTMLSDWTLEWKYPTLTGETDDDVTYQQIPQEYRHTKTKVERMEDNDSENDSKSKAESDMDSDSDSSSTSMGDDEDAQDEDVLGDKDGEKMETDG
ncbi:hypothetical protein F4860DRAFT_526946 [Xylaria cubensis]|nr:hypothetical protein F4860DRAFT_526946 [Xylaria cubensis]